MAQHQMAEWLGSNIVDLYAVLEAMGHVKEHHPADEIKEEEAVEKPSEAEVPEDKVKEEGAIESVVISMEKPEQVKPDLATFRLKKGKAINASASSASKPNQKFSDQKKFTSDKKKFKPKGNKGKKSGDKKPAGQRVYKAEAEAKPEDSPFAILEQLKVGNKKEP